jgi:hypothetical protein
MNEIDQDSDVNQIMNIIKEEISSSQPFSRRIINLLYDLRTKEEYKSLSDTDYYDIVGETLKLNPEFFMDSIYPRMRSFHFSLEMAKYIVEHFCLYDNEQIIYEFPGDITQMTTVKVSVKGGHIFVTNYRIIAQGILKAKGGRNPNWGLAVLALSGGSARRKGKKSVIDVSQEIPCYGYQFKSRAHIKLEKRSKTVRYILHGGGPVPSLGFGPKITITPPRNQVNELYEVLSKNVDQVVDMFQEIQDMGGKERIKRMEFLYRLPKLWQSDEYRNFSDSDYLEVIRRVYELDPEFFMTFIYPEMISWHFPSFLSVKEEIITLVDKLNKEFIPSNLE